VIQTSEELKELARDRYDREMSIEEVFEGITDLSYVGFQGEREDLEPIVYNTPGWGHVYSIPVEDLLRLDIPVMNLGPLGKDAHKNTERLELASGLEVAPALLAYAVHRICELIR
jgi:arginine utilization protein RocB